jgi:hypothetical protein
MKPDMKTRLESMGFIQTDTITLGRREIPVFGMKMLKDTLKPHGNATQNSVQNSCQ